MQWLEDTDVLEMIIDKFSSSDCPEVHANAAEVLCAITRYAPPGITSKLSSPSFIGRLFRHALEDSRPKSVLVNSLSVCISLLDPKRVTSGAYYMYNRQTIKGSGITANPETVEGMLESIGDLVKLLDVSSEDYVLLTTYGKLQPPLGKHRLKIIEFISVLVTVSSEAAEKELIRLGAVKRIEELFFEYPYNNFLHHHVEQIILSCLESKNFPSVEHLLHDCNLVGKILEAEKDVILAADSNKPTVPAEGKSPPRIGNIGHITRIANKLVQLGNNDIQSHLQKNSEWVEWHTNVLPKCNAVENVFQWACGRPTALQDRTRDSDDDNYQDRDYDVAALANNLSQAFRYGIDSNDDIDEDVYFDDESAEVVISSLRLGNDQESSSLFTNSSWFAFEDDSAVNERSTGPVASPSSKIEGTGADEKNILDGDGDLADTATSELPESKPDPATDDLSKDLRQKETVCDKPPEWVEWRERSDLGESPDPTSDLGVAPSLPNGELQVESEVQAYELGPNSADASPPDVDKPVDALKTEVGESLELSDVNSGSQTSQSGDGNQSSHNALLMEKAPIITEGSSGGSESRSNIDVGNICKS